MYRRISNKVIICSAGAPIIGGAQVDTGAGASAAGAGAGAEHARCLVRALCRLLGKVSLRVLLQGAQQIAPTTGASDTVEGAGVRMEAAEVRR